MKFGPDIIGAQRMSCSNFVDSLTLPLAPPAGQNMTLSQYIGWLVYDQIPNKQNWHFFLSFFT